jgi:twitching motility protein PilT
MLKRAVSSNAQRLTIIQDAIPSLTVDGRIEMGLDDLGAVDASFMDNMTSFLFPNADANERHGGILIGVLQVPQVGTLNVLRYSPVGGLCIQVYLPSGQDLFELDKKNAASQRQNQAKASQPLDMAMSPLPQIPNPTNTNPPIPQPPRPAVGSASEQSKANSPASGQQSGEMFQIVLKKPKVQSPSNESSKPVGEKEIPVPAFSIPESPVSAQPQLQQNESFPPEVSVLKKMAPTIDPVTSSSEYLQAAGRVFDVEQKFEPKNIEVKFPTSSETVIPFTSEASLEVKPISFPEVGLNVETSSLKIPNLIQPPAAEGNGMDAFRSMESRVPKQDIPTKIDFGGEAESSGAVSSGKNPIDRLLKKMIELKASDMHLTIGQPVIYRINGDIERQDGDILTAETMEALISPTLQSRNREEFAKINDTDYAYEYLNVGRFRINIFRDRNGVGGVLRHIPSNILSAETLNLPPAIMNFCKLNKGLVLVTGPTGSGKSTTLAAMLDWINKNRHEHILTIEDPIEFVHQQKKCLVNQREVHKHTGSFARALKAALREDPDIILIGEMRDLETIAIAIETAETGHLVFGTLHTTTAMSTVDRIIDQFPADRQAQIRTMLASSLRGVVTQTLLKKKSGGRIAAHEILVSNDAVSAMVREGKIYMIANHMMTQKQEGNQLLNDALFKLIADGHVDPQEALFKAVDKNDFILAAARKNVKLAG